MRYDPTTEEDIEADADEWFDSATVLRDGLIDEINIALGPFGIEDPNEDTIVTAVTFAVATLIELRDGQ